MSAYRLLKQLGFWFLTVIRIDALARRLNRHKLVIVCYHGVVAERKSSVNSWLLLPLPKFEQQLAYLRRNYDIRDLDSAVRLLRGRALARPTACITFDDGYRNNY